MIAWLAALIPGSGPALAFLTGPLGRVLAVAALAGAAYVAGHIKGRGDAAAAAREQSLRNELAIARIDSRLQKEAAASSARDAKIAAETAARKEEQVRAFEKEIASRGPSNGCRLGDDARRVRRIINSR